MKQNYKTTLKCVTALWCVGPDFVLYILFYLYTKHGLKSGGFGQQFSIKLIESPLKSVASSVGFPKFARTVALEMECLNVNVKWESPHISSTKLY